MLQDEWADVRCRGLEEARWCRAVLEAAAIEAVIPDEHTLGLPLAPEPAGTVRVLVRSSELERALDALDAAARPGGTRWPRE